MIVRKLNVRGGVQRHALSLAHEYVRMGHTVTVHTFVADPGASYGDLMAGLRIVSLGRLPQPGRSRFLKIGNYFIGILREARAARSLAMLIDRDTDILNPHDHVCYKVAYFYKRRVKNIPAAWTMHDLPTKYGSFLRNRELVPGLRLSPFKRFGYWLNDKYESGFIRSQDAVAVLDPRDRDWARVFFKKEATVIGNGVDERQFRYVPRSVPRGKACRILMNGICMPHRRFEDGIAALAELRGKGVDCALTIIGAYDEHDPYYRSLRALAEKLGVADAVSFTGEANEEVLKDSYRTHDVFLFPNHLQSWGLAVFEAMASGCPVVVSRSAGAADVLAHRVHAMIVPPKSPDAIASAVRELVGDAKLYVSVSTEGRRFVESDISWARTARAMQNVFMQLV